MLGGMIRSFFVRQQGERTSRYRTAKDLLELSELVDSGKLTTVIDRTYPLAETPEAMAYVGTGHAHGKVVIRSSPRARSVAPFCRPVDHGSILLVE